MLAVYTSPTTAPYLETKVGSKKSGQVFRATELRTLVSCDGEHVSTSHPDLDNCLRTAHGNSAIVSVMPTPASKSDMTYTVLVEGKTDLIYVGGILTHAKLVYSARPPTTTRRRRRLVAAPSSALSSKAKINKLKHNSKKAPAAPSAPKFATARSMALIISYWSSPPFLPTGTAPFA